MIRLRHDPDCGNDGDLCACGARMFRAQEMEIMRLRAELRKQRDAAMRLLAPPKRRRRKKKASVPPEKLEREADVLRRKRM